VLARLAGAIALAALAVAAAAAPGIPKRIPQSKLALMPLPLSAFGAEAAKLKVDTSESGVDDNAEAASDSTDTKDTAKTLAAAGRVTGYEVTYADYNAFGKPGSLVGVSTEVVLLTSSAKATAYVQRELRDFVLSDKASGFIVQGSTRFDVSGLGDEAQGIRASVKFPAGHIWVTGVIVRRGELLVEIAVVRTDDRSEDALATRAAKAAVARVQGVLSGAITTPPAKLPKEEPKTPAGKPKVAIAGGLPSPADLHGATVTRQEYVKDEDTVASYEREFDNARVGGTKFLSIETDLALYPTSGEAGLFLAGIRGVFNPSNPTFKEFITNAFKEGSGGLRLTSYTVRHKSNFTISGGEGIEVTLGLVTPVGKFDAAYVFMRSGPFIGSIFALGNPTTGVKPADVASLYRLFAKRIRAQGKKIGKTA
jgi:hypothetical protein